MECISSNHALLSFHCIPRNYKMQMTMNKRQIICNSISLSSNAAIVVGAGVAGSALSHALAKDGRRVHVIERSLKEPNKIVGEMLQPGGYLNLGLEVDAQILLGYMIILDGKTIKFPSERYFARSFHYGRFVQKLRHQATTLPNVYMEQGIVTNLIVESGIIKGVRYKNVDGDETAARALLTVVCDGGFYDLRKFLSKPKVDQSSHVISLTLENCEIPDRNYARMVSGNPGIAVYPLSSTELRCGISFTGSKLPSIFNGQMADFLKTEVLPLIPPEISSAFVSSVEKGKIRSMPISCMPASPQLIPGALLLGDALNMRHAILAGGMTVALHDVVLIHSIFTRDVNLQDLPTVMQYTKHFYNSRKLKASVMNLVADSAYKVFYTTPDEIKKEINRAVFNYYSRREPVTREYTELVYGLRSEPSWSLMFNVFVGSAYVFGSVLFAIRSPKQVRALALWAVDATVFVSLRVWNDTMGQVSFTGDASQQNKLN